MTKRHNRACASIEAQEFREQVNCQSTQQRLQQRYRLTYDLQSLTHLRNIEDKIFEEAQEAWQVLNEEGSIRVDGKTYEQIEKSPDLKGELEKVRANAPVYQNLSTRKKNALFKTLGAQYRHRLKHAYPKSELMRTSDNISQTLDVTQSEPFFTGKYHKKIQKKRNSRLFLKKHKQCSREGEEQVQPSCEENSEPAKRVSFSVGSAFKYFCRSDPSEIIEAEQQFVCSTFAKQ